MKMFCIHGPMYNLLYKYISLAHTHKLLVWKKKENITDRKKSVYTECNAWWITLFVLIVNFFHFHKGVTLIMLEY